MIKLLSLFSGIGAFEKALTNLGVNYEVVNYCEIDKFASKSYALIHNVNENKNLKDVTKVDTSKLPNDIDLVTYGFPCQDISVAGKMKGFEDVNGNRTRSGLFFEALRIIEDTKPKVAIAENVKALTSKKFTKQFNTVLKSLDEAGYNSYWQVIDSHNYGIPQRRERLYIVSIRKDIDNNQFKFPNNNKLSNNLYAFLDTDVDCKYRVRQPSMLRKLHEGKLKVVSSFVYTITTKQVRCPNAGVIEIDKHFDNYRYLTEVECFRLMGFDDRDCDILKENGISMTQMYKQAGNSIVVDVLEELFKELFNAICIG